MKIVLYCSLLFYAAVTEFVFGPLERGMTENKAVHGDAVQYLVIWGFCTFP
jgi:hypothetical protein